MRPSKWISESQLLPDWLTGLAGRRADPSNIVPLGMGIRRTLLLVLGTVALATLSMQARSQSLSYSGDFSGSVGSTTSEKPEFTYVPPTQATKAKNFAFDAFGPYAIVGGVFFGGIDQATGTPPEWKQGFGGYAERFGSDFGIAAASTTTRYLLANALKEDTLYYRCECTGVFPRLGHAVVSTLAGRSGRDGHRVFSFPALAAPYAGSALAVYGWYPRRYGVEDVFRMGNYTLLESVGGNIALEFLYSGPHSLLSRMHLNNSHGSPIQGPNR
jgi:hypothetical protein